MRIWAEPANPLQESSLTEGIEPWTFLLTPAPRYFFLPPPKNVCNAFMIRVFPSFVTSVTSPPAGWHHPSRQPVSHLQHLASPPLTSTLHVLLSPPYWHWGHVMFFLFFFSFADSWERCGNTEQMARGRSGALTNDCRVPWCCLSVCRRVSVFSISGPAEGDVQRPFPCLLIQQFLLDFKGILRNPGPRGVMATDCI